MYTCTMQIVVLDGYTLNPGDLSWTELQKLGAVKVYDRTSEDQVVERARDAELILTNKVVLNRAILEQLPKLKYIGVTATGYNIIDLECAQEQGIVVSNVPGYSTGAVAQLTFAFLLEICLHVQKHSDAVRAGRWSQSPDFSFWDYPLMELEGKTLGIFGFGQIGQRVADIAHAFGMQVLAHSRTRTNQDHRKGFQWVSQETLFRQSDFISLHCPLTSETQGLVNRDTLALMQNTAYIINTGRGPLIVEADLAEALNTHQIAGAALDVLSKEPPTKDNPLLSAENCLISPHIGWASREARIRLLDITLENIAAFLQGKPLNQVHA